MAEAATNATNPLSTATGAPTQTGARPTGQRTGQQRLRARLIWLGALVVILLLASVALRQRVDDELRTRVSAMFAETYPNLNVRVDWARRLGERGIELRGVVFTNPKLGGRFREVLSIERLELQCDTSLASLAAGDVDLKHVIIDGPRLRGVRGATGGWSFTCLMPKAPPGGKTPTPSVEVRNGEIELVDTARPEFKLALWRDVDLHLSPASALASGSPQPSGLVKLPPTQPEAPAPSVPETQLKPRQEAVVWTFGGKMQSGRLGQTNIQGWFGSPASWHLEGRIHKLMVDAETWDLLPTSMWRNFGVPPKLGAKLDVSFRVDQGPNEAIQFATWGELTDGWVDDPRCAFPLTAIRSGFEFTSEHFVAKDFFARTGDAEIGGAAIFHDFELKQPYSISGTLKRFPVDQRLRSMLSARLQETFDKFKPTGRCGGTIAVSFDGRDLKPNIKLTCAETELEYDRFPYRLRGASGTLDFVDERLTVDFTAPLHGGDVIIKATLLRPGAHTIGEIVIQTGGHIPLDEDLIAAMPASSRPLIRELSPRGWFKTYARFHRDDPAKLFERVFSIDVRDGAVRYEKFPYAIHHIGGVISVHDDVWTFRDLKGGNGSGYIEASGNWDPRALDEKNLRMTLHCHDVALNEELQAALPAGMQQLWHDLHPNGTVDYLDVELGYDRGKNALSVDVVGEKWDARQVNDRQPRRGRPISILPSWFPYRFEDMTGRFRYVDGKVILTQVRGRHDRTEVQQVNGEGVVTPAGDWELQLNDLVVSGLVLDRDLLHAFPDSVRDSLARVQVDAPMGMQGGITFFGGPGEQPETRWKLDFDIEDSRIACGPVFEHVRGQARLTGAAGRDGFFCDGELAVDSVLFRDHHFVQVKGPLRIDSNRIYFGSYATAQQERRVPKSVEAEILGGTVTLDGHVDTRRMDLKVDVTVENASLRDIGREFGLQRSDVTGKAALTASIVGKAHDPQTWRGGGVVRLWDANLYESPFMARLLSVLKNARFDKSAFSRSNMDYRIEGDRIVFDRVTLEGPIRLLGRGELTRQRQIDMNFNVELVDEKRQLPIFRPLAMGANRNALSISVTGTLDEPIIVKQPFPELNRGLQEFFVETAGREAAGR
jgi:hypothetical protein